MNAKYYQCHLGRDRVAGSSLLIALLFLVIVAMIGVAVGNVSTLEERMAGATRDRDLSLQAAEAALSDAQAQLLTSGFRATAFPAYNAVNANTSTYWETCFAGTASPCATKYTPSTTLPTSGTGAVAAQPQYIVEQKPSGPGTTLNYRVTARAVGGTTTSVVVLQAEYAVTP